MCKLIKITYAVLFASLPLSFHSVAEGSNVIGTWKVKAQAGSLGVGPTEGSKEWFSIDPAGVEGRACFYDDTYVFNEDGSFENILGDETFLEDWQSGAEPTCGVPVAPHDGSTPGEWSYNEAAGTLTLTGTGSYLGLPKANNAGELPKVDVPSSITYNFTFVDESNATVTIESGAGVWWTFELEKETGEVAEPITKDFSGTWQVAPQAGALAVGPSAGSSEWWSSSIDELTIRDCFFDDQYVFNSSGSFTNVLGDQTYLEDWQSGAEPVCGSPVAPHDGMVEASWAFDETTDQLTISGAGAYIGLPKATNDGELPKVAVPNSVIYNVSFADNQTASLTIEAGSGVFWTFKIVKVSDEEQPSMSYLSHIPVWDMNDDGIQEIAQFGLRETDDKPQLVAMDPVSGEMVKTYTWPDAVSHPQIVILSDHNGDEVHEVGLYGYNKQDMRPQLYVKDGATGQALGTWSWPANWGEAKFMQLHDITNDGVMDLAIYGTDSRSGRTNVVPKDGTDPSVSLDTVVWPNLWSNTEVFEGPDVNGDGVNEVAMYGTRNASGKNQVFVKDFLDPTFKFVYNWPDNWDDVGSGLANDVNGDGVSDIALVGVRKDDGRPQAVIKDGTDRRKVVGNFGWPDFLIPNDFLNVSDRDGDDQSDIALYATRDDGRRQVVVKSSASRKTIDSVGWNSNWSDTFIHELHDISGDGITDFALFGTNNNSGAAQLVVIDSDTGETMKPFTWPALTAVNASIVEMGDLNGDGVPDIAAYSIVDGQGMLYIKDGANGADMKTIVWGMGWY